MQSPRKRPAFVLDTQICTGCKTCMVACRDRHDLPAGVDWRRVIEYSGGTWEPLGDGAFRQNVFAYYLSVSCNHCAKPVCVSVCPTSAMHQKPNGIVSVDAGLCIGCRSCERACPYGAPQYLPERGRMSKCDLCRDELKTGGIPACVAACPTRALGIDEFEHIEPGIAVQTAMAPLPDHGLTAPRTLFKPHRSGRPTGSPDGSIANPEE